MREIKFRCWDKDFNEYSSYHLNRTTVNNIKECERFVFEQFTGLKDKLRNEIYEGDIVRILYTDWGSKPESDPRTLDKYLEDIASIGIVEFNNSSWEVFFKSEKDEYFDEYSSIYPGKYGYIEVIGNIHEHKHLIS